LEVDVPGMPSVTNSTGLYRKPGVNSLGAVN